MIKKYSIIPLCLLTHSLCTATSISLYKAPLDRLEHYSTASQTSVALPDNQLIKINQTKQGSQTIIRYQQTYKGIRVAGAQVTVNSSAKLGSQASPQAEVNGHLIEDIHINIKPALTTTNAIALAKNAYFNTKAPVQTVNETATLEIRSAQDNQLKLMYLVSFKTAVLNSNPEWPVFVIDAQTGEITNQWNNVKTYLDSGPGGNQKTSEYWYGKDGLPGLHVTKKGNTCSMEDANVTLVNLRSAWDRESEQISPFEYPCNENSEDFVNGAFSTGNDAYYFAHTIVNMYQKWYGIHALQNENGQSMKLIMRVHFGKNFDNAFWDGKTMTFGDGYYLYPLVSLDIAGHEVTHGFTQQHSDLEYHDQSGALNEAMSDMAGQASRAYLLDTNPELYNKSNLTPNEISWGLGETVMREPFGKAIRFMNSPSLDGYSADCYNKKLARRNKSYCAISYDEVEAMAELDSDSESQKQSYIVHQGSGVFNKAFYLMAKSIGIKSAYHIMIIANTTYWTPTTTFTEGACGVLYAAEDLKIDLNIAKSAFGKVGIDLSSCVI